MPNSQTPPPEVPDFNLLHRVGRGGFGEVWLARNRATEHLRAVKLIPLASSGTVDPAGREITSLTRLEANVRQKHPNLLDIHHVGRTEEHLFYVMELADDVTGERPQEVDEYRPASLERRLSAGPLPADECFRRTEQLLAGLAALHEAGMVHRDVKPANCLFVDGALKLADFGLLTESHGAVSRIGTETYMPPDGRMDTRADVYAAGLVIYEMLTGLPAKRFPTLARRVEALRSNRRLAALNRLALAACQREPGERPADARAMAAMLDDLVHDDGQLRTWLQTPVVWVTAMSAVLLTTAALIWPGLGNRPDVPNASDSANVSAADETVAVSFITEPFEAEILVDGQTLLGPDGTAYRTPCTVPDIPPGEHDLVFRRDGNPDLPAGRIDFTTTREVDMSW